ncbi:MAG TPA: universal stress protein [Steroidobacteraceae bacterium]|nr:universal stress protein [Steroidobacteraceae bacterium]
MSVRGGSLRCHAYFPQRRFARNPRANAACFIMVRPFRCVLVAIADAHAVSRTALTAAAALARSSGAQIELFHAAKSGAGEAALRRVRTSLERAARSSALRGCRVRTLAVAQAPASGAIVHRALAIRADLVVAATRTRARGRRLLQPRTDRELIRHCPCPLLVVRTARTLRGRAVLVAIDPFHAHAKPARLDALLLATGRRLGALLGGAVHAFHAYMPLVASVQGPLGEPIVWEDPRIEDTHAAQVRHALDRLAERAGIARANRHLALGDVPTQLPVAVRRLGVGIVVLGAVSRTGLKRLLIGSTAQRVLDRLPCDLLVVKPHGLTAAVRASTARAASARGRR